MILSEIPKWKGELVDVEGEKEGELDELASHRGSLGAFTVDFSPPF